MIFSRMIGESWTGRGQAVERSYDVKKMIPIRRGPVRRRLGMAWYSARRYLLWCSGKYRFAKSRERRDVLTCVAAGHATPLLRKLCYDFSNRNVL